jgi:hypothetical protein
MQSTEQGTPGVFSFGSTSVFSLELPWLNNAKRLSCIPAGTYQLAWKRSPKFGLVYHVLAVPARSSILIHPANFAGGSGFDTELHGCIAPCMRLGRLRNSRGVMQLAGLVSRPAVSAFHAWAAGESLELEIS